MISLRKALGILTSSPWIGSRVKAEESRLLRLSTEIILLILSMLPTPHAACLALCNHRLSHIIGPNFWVDLRDESADGRLEFLELLVRDLPGRFLCQQCVRIHRINSICWPRIPMPQYIHRCSWRPGYGYPSPFWYLQYFPLINFPHVQLAMKQHYSGVDIGFPLEAFQYLRVERKHNQNQQKTTLLSVGAQIVSEELLIRSQTWTVLPWSRRNDFIKELAKDYSSRDICIHTKLGPLDPTLVSDLVRSRLEKLDAREECRAETLHCPYCWLDYDLRVIDSGERGFAVILTRWVNLGSGLHVTDPKWQSHLEVRMPEGVHQPHLPGDIRASFENQAGVSVEDLTNDNELNVFSTMRSRLLSRIHKALAVNEIR